jgi:hypothetical protein
MRSEAEVRRVFELWDDGWSKKRIAADTGVSRTQVREWIEQGIEATLRSPMRRGVVGPNGPCDGSCGLSESVAGPAYAYLLGMYLGDGCISEGRRDVFKLRISMCDAYPNIRAECEDAIRSVMPDHRVGAVQRPGCTEICSHSKHWPCLFPQHGPGRKHTRPIELEPWQETIAFERHPDRLLRGLIHSDGCRCINRVTRPTNAGPKRYAYARYLFTNESEQIRGIFVEACRRLSIEYCYNRPNSISVARRDSVELLDSFVGPKS